MIGLWWKKTDKILSRFHTIPERNGQTDGRTHRFAISISRVSILRRDKNGTKYRKFQWNTNKDLHTSYNDMKRARSLRDSWPSCLKHLHLYLKPGAGGGVWVGSVCSNRSSDADFLIVWRSNDVSILLSFRWPWDGQRMDDGQQTDDGSKSATIAYMYMSFFQCSDFMHVVINTSNTSH